MNDDLQKQINRLERKVNREKLARQEAETLLEDKSRELFLKNEKLEETNQKLKESQGQLVQSEKMAGLGQMAAGMAHEINNPMGFIASNLQILSEYEEAIKHLLKLYHDFCSAQTENKALQAIEDFKQAEDFEFVMKDMQQLIAESKEGAKRVIDIVANLKSFARLDESKQKMADINEGIRSTLKIMSNLTKYKCQVETHFGDLPETFCYAGELNQVFMNIITNAAQAMEEFGQIVITTQSDGRAIDVQIKDNAGGIPQDIQDKIFDPFFTTKKVGEGTGLGLSISHGIVQKHQGELRFEVEEGVGTTFFIKLPILAPQSDA